MLHLPYHKSHSAPLTIAAVPHSCMQCLGAFFTFPSSTIAACHPSEGCVILSGRQIAGAAGKELQTQPSGLQTVYKPIYVFYVFYEICGLVKMLRVFAMQKVSGKSLNVLLMFQADMQSGVCVCVHLLVLSPLSAAPARARHLTVPYRFFSYHDPGVCT